MSELKARTSGEIRARDALLGYWWYEKSEADKVIAHQKYKRCLAMARWCVGKYENYSLLANEACQRGCYKSEARWDRQADKWLSRKSRWLELAEKFKEAK